MRKPILLLLLAIVAVGTLIPVAVFAASPQQEATDVRSERAEHSQRFPHFPYLHRLFYHEGKLHSASIEYEDKDGTVHTVTVVAGVVAAKTDSSVTIDPNGSGANRTINVTADTKIIKAGKQVRLSEVNLGDNMVVASRDGNVIIFVEPFAPKDKERPVRPNASEPTLTTPAADRLAEVRERLAAQENEMKAKIEERLKNVDSDTAAKVRERLQSQQTERQEALKKRMEELRKKLEERKAPANSTQSGSAGPI